jgi:NAD(P)-dependent dehydrogenase (short-subunit alcohol dehydrogenase family)
MAVPVDELTKDGKEIMIRSIWLVSDFNECWSGYDLHFGVNVLSHFHLTMLLLPGLARCRYTARVVNLSSLAHQFAPAEGITFEKLKAPKKPAWFPLSSLNERYRYYGEVI